jgi:hypothetical protein
MKSGPRTYAHGSLPFEHAKKPDKNTEWDIQRTDVDRETQKVEFETRL